MSAIRTFTVTVQSTAGGNKYFIDGVQQATVTLAEGYTYRFDVSDSSVGSHPFRFSTTSDGTHSGGSQYTTGVTVTASYVEIAVADPAPQLYYYCTAHSGMGGAANTEPADTWGVLQWGQNSWSGQDGVSVSLTGLSATTSIGSVTAFNETGTMCLAYKFNICNGFLSFKFSSAISSSLVIRESIFPIAWSKSLIMYSICFFQIKVSCDRVRVLFFSL